MTPRIAIITPSYRRDFELCRTLNASVLEFLPAAVKHYVFVDRRDVHRFRCMRGERTIVAAKEEIMPGGIFQLPGMNRWISPATPFPISGWLVQQIAKIATAELIDADVLVMVDSDALFVRDVEPSVFATNGITRLYRCPDAITANKQSHVTWHRNACRLLDVTPDELPMDDYIGQVISWDRQIVRRMCAHLEQISGMSWQDTLAKARDVSEYLLYGLFVAKVIGAPGNVWIDERSRCKTHWELSPLRDSELVKFATSLDDGDFAVMISSHSGTSSKIRRSAVELATNGRLR
jgi:hypothetical protein